MNNLQKKKLNKLKNILSKMDSVIVAYSGGVDSSLLLKVAQDILQDDCFSVIASSATYPKEELQQAKYFAKKIKAKHRIIKTEEFKDKKFRLNPKERCYFCKRELFGKLKKIAKEKSIRFVADGSNVDDLKDFRPGIRAAAELGVRSPLQEAGLTKKDIRVLSKRLKMPMWDKASSACLASRIPFKMEIKKQDLVKINSAEKALRSLDFKQVRVRHYRDLARIEVSSKDINDFVRLRSKIVVKLKKLGYNYITVDLEGYGNNISGKAKQFIW